MCYPIVKEQDFPARRKELQTNPDYRAPKAFCQTLSPKKYGAKNRARAEKRSAVIRPNELWHHDVPAIDPKFGQNWRARGCAWPSPGRKRSEALIPYLYKNVQVHILVRIHTSRDICTQTLIRSTLFHAGDHREISARTPAASGPLLPRYAAPSTGVASANCASE